VTLSGGGIMVGVAITYRDVCIIYTVEGTSNDPNYLDILAKCFIPSHYLLAHRNYYIFKEDDAP
jgi:hypothetical protein